MAKSTAPIYLPSNKKYPEQRFELYAGWTDAYAIRVRGAGQKGAYYYQIKRGLVFKHAKEGPSDAQVNSLNAVLFDKSCVPETNLIEICTVPAREYTLGRQKTKITAQKFARVKHADATLISELTTNAFY